ncbi:MAG: Gfo/Idh/MocA family oxidoreductase [Verrucomicrobia bacterium]|nr:Gfo/Idh/MocA family oxidoreductase [Verrucomicrobiota bacterium]
MNNSPTITRRNFIKTTATAGAVGLAAPNVIPATVLGKDGKPPPSERIQVGLIGCNGMGRGNLANCAKHPDVVVTAACDVWKVRSDAVVKQHKDTCKPYSDFRELLQQKDVDAVIIATPPHWHTLVAIMACEAGKDIYLQKPMTLHLGESLAVRNAVKKHNRVCQVGTQIHAGENYRRVVELIQAGYLGKVACARTFNVMNQGGQGVGKQPPDTKTPEGLDWNFWCGPAELIPYNSILATGSYHHGSWMAYSGGWTPGMAPHIIDLPVWALDLGFPIETTSSGGRFIIKDDGDAYDNHEVLWRYPNCTVTWMSSLTNSYGFDLHGNPVPMRRLGIYFHGVNGTMYANYGEHRIIPEGKAFDPFILPDVAKRKQAKEFTARVLYFYKELQPVEKTIPPSPGHEREWLDCIKSRQQPSCTPQYHCRVDVPIVLSLLSYKLGRTIKFDPATEKIVGDPEAAKLAVPKYRDPWKFPEQYLNA